MNKLSNAHVEAVYSPQRIQRFQGNPLIEALPPTASEEDLVRMLTQLPDFSPEQREWPTAERLNQVAGLADFCVPLARHVQLAFTLDSMLRQGYVGREPRTLAHTKVLQSIYENQKAGAAFVNKPTHHSTAFSTSLIGVSGMGKTRTLQRLEEQWPSVIYHPALHTWQIPVLHIETPHDGASVKGLAHSILRQVDKLIPDANYYETYALKSRASVETLLNHVARVLHLHSVGLLVFDEIQNLENAPKNKQSLMTLLVSASNELGVPVLFVGTNKARRVLSLDFRQARRSVGHGLAYWDRLRKNSSDEPEEWSGFLGMLWKFQWLNKPVALNAHLSDLMYHHSQGIIDVAIKLFAACQWRAMLDGSEAITAQLIDDVAKKELALIMPMVEALRNNDLKALEAYDDIAPLNMEALLQSIQAKLAGKRVLGAAIRPGDSMFTTSVSNALAALGVDMERANAIADTVESDGVATNVLDAAKKAIDQLTPPKRVRANSKGSGSVPSLPPLEPADLRNASRRAEAARTTVFAQLLKMGAVCDLRAILALH